MLNYITLTSHAYFNCPNNKSTKIAVVQAECFTLKTFKSYDDLVKVRKLNTNIDAEIQSVFNKLNTNRKAEDKARELKFLSKLNLNNINALKKLIMEFFFIVSFGNR